MEEEAGRQRAAGAEVRAADVGLGGLHDRSGTGRGHLEAGEAVHRAEVARRLGTTVVVQFDEPLLPAALAGRLAGASALNPVHPIDAARPAPLPDAGVQRVGGAVPLPCPSLIHS